MIKVDLRRVRSKNNINLKSGKVIYWMSRDQRVKDNWALLYAQELAFKNDSELLVVFNLQSNFLNANLNHFSFMIEGLQQVEKDLQKLNINFKVLCCDSTNAIVKFLHENKVGGLVADFSPLKTHLQWLTEIVRNVSCAVFEVDAHNIVPCWQASNKQEFSARTFRPKITNLLDEFLTDFPELKKMSKQNFDSSQKMTNDWQKIKASVTAEKISKQKIRYLSGEKNAHLVWQDFFSNKIHKYSELKNNPTVDYPSNLSPYLHFGQISAQRIALFVEDQPVFFEELVVRRELAENYCYYNQNYDNFNGFPEWAKKTLTKHISDIRPYQYSLSKLENAETHDQIWNYFQKQMIKTGKMHGYMRMYWAKKILEWTQTPQQAQKIAIYLNDKYELDGRDPNGYVGIAWAIGGLHDRPWFERKIFGQIRYMNQNGLERKFNISILVNKKPS